jgi:hypothetical protein
MSIAPSVIIHSELVSDLMRGVGVVVQLPPSAEQVLRLRGEIAP